jgi:riboflavin biosynthesis pyrimidine reductase
MGRVILQMMISVDGMLAGPKGELDWIAADESLNQAHQAVLEQSDIAILGAGAAPDMSKYWIAAEHDEKEKANIRSIARAFNEIPKIIYSHKPMPIDWHNAKVHVVDGDRVLAEDVQRLKRETKRSIIVYGGVRMAQTFVRLDLPDELHLNVCPVILGGGKPLFTDLKHRTKLRLRETKTYESGAAMMRYEVRRES